MLRLTVQLPARLARARTLLTSSSGRCSASAAATRTSCCLLASIRRGGCHCLRLHVVVCRMHGPETYIKLRPVFKAVHGHKDAEHLRKDMRTLLVGQHLAANACPCLKHGMLQHA